MLGVMRMNEDQRDALGKAARARIRRQFDIDAKADEWMELYGRLLCTGNAAVTAAQ